MTLEQALALSAQLSSDSPRVDVEALLCHLLARPRAYLYTWPERELEPAQEERFLQLLARRQAGEPVAYLTGQRSFWTLELEVSPDTLIPRADTELLVEWVLAQLPEQPPLRVADLGTGTGAIALALASERPHWQIQGCDRVPAAVALAQRNAQRLGLEQVRFVEGDWLQPLEGRFDLLISNPPYIDADDPHLQQGDLRYEPHSALVASDEGLADLRYLIQSAPAYLNVGGWLLLEHGYRQAQAVRELLRAQGFEAVFSERDYGGHERISGGCYRAQ